MKLTRRTLLVLVQLVGMQSKRPVQLAMVREWENPARNTVTAVNTKGVTASCPPSHGRRNLFGFLHPSLSPIPPFAPTLVVQIVEEGPVTIAPPDVVHELEQGARRLAKIVGYCGVATVEYLYSMVHGNYFFLEVNPRLQVRYLTTPVHGLGVLRRQRKEQGAF